VPAPLLVLTAIVSVQVGSSLAKQLFDDLGARRCHAAAARASRPAAAARPAPGVRRWTRALVDARAAARRCHGRHEPVFYLSLRTVPLGVAVTVEFLGPLLLALVQTRRRSTCCGRRCAAGGVALLGAGHLAGVPLSGLLLAFVAGLFWAAYIVASARVGQVLPGHRRARGGAGLRRAARAAVRPVRRVGGVERPVLLLAAFGVALLSSVISYGLELAALRRIPTQVFGHPHEPRAGSPRGRRASRCWGRRWGCARWSRSCW
jgi:inner membrane transporter RhtA